MYMYKGLNYEPIALSLNVDRFLCFYNNHNYHDSVQQCAYVPLSIPSAACT